jgi:hypothetical protein
MIATWALMIIACPIQPSPTVKMNQAGTVESPASAKPPRPSNPAARMNGVLLRLCIAPAQNSEARKLTPIRTVITVTARAEP